MARYNYGSDDWRPVSTEDGREVYRDAHSGRNWFGPTPGVIDGSAPQRDFSKDKPMSPSAPYVMSRNNVTPTAVWNDMFHNRANVSATAPVPTNPVNASLASVGANITRPALPSLTQTANGGMNHAQKWESAAAGQQNVRQYQAPGTIAMTTFDSTPGTRQPFIAGANGVNVGPQIAAKVNPTDPTLDKNYMDQRKQPFSWASAFR